MAAVTHNGLALEFVHEQSHEICLTAVLNNCDDTVLNEHALYYVHEQTPEICLAAVNQDWTTLDLLCASKICVYKRYYRRLKYTLESFNDVDYLKVLSNLMCT